MKKPHLYTVLIVAASAPLLFLQERQIAHDRETLSQLMTQARALGIPTDGTRRTKSLSETSLRDHEQSQRPMAQTAAQDYAKELLHLAKQVRTSNDFSPEFEMELMSFFSDLFEQDPSVLIQLFELLWDSEELTEDERPQVMEPILTTLIQSYPEDGLALLSDLRPKLAQRYPDYENGEFPELIMMALTEWTAFDPQAAKEWLTNNPDLASEEALRAVQIGILENEFSRDFSQALPLFAAMNEADIEEFFSNWELDLSSQERKLSLLDFIAGELSEKVEPNQDSREPYRYLLLQGELYNRLGTVLATEGPEASETLFVNSDLGAEEREIIATQITVSDPRDPAAWLPFFSKHLTNKSREYAIRNTIENWTLSDFRATAQWIGEQPAGDLKELATFSFAETIMPHEPSSAADWAETLSPSAQRHALMVDILYGWKEKDPEAAQAFAARHHLKIPE
ncbi:hypothetical protein AAFN60_10715 [Roseibacillus persicicus]|uniref:hypothetical protein n=1 Tax=Roseibacillus persicicus TaxID=454148 RepID=UPI00398B6DCA